MRHCVYRTLIFGLKVIGSFVFVLLWSLSWSATGETVSLSITEEYLPSNNKTLLDTSVNTLPHQHKDTVADSLLILLFLILASLFVSNVLCRIKLSYLQGPSISAFLGFFLGVCSRCILSSSDSLFSEMIYFNDQFLFLGLLPPIIFHSGFSLVGYEREQFFTNLDAILCFAVIGTFVAFSVLGGLMYLFSLMGFGGLDTVRGSFAFGAAMSSTDPVIAITMFQSTGVSPMLNAILSGESLMNDALSILLYRSMASTSSAGHLHFWVFNFLFVLVFSVTLGVAFGLILALLYKHARLEELENGYLECALLLLLPYTCYLISEKLGMAAIVSVLFMGMTLSRYAYPNMSEMQKKLSKSMFGAMGLLTESATFILLGLAAVWAPHPSTLDLGLYLTSAISILASRFISVYLCGLMVNLFREKEHQLSSSSYMILFLGGGRGAVAFALALRSRNDFGIDTGSKMISATLVYALLSIVLISVLLPCYIQHEERLCFLSRKLLKGDEDGLELYTSLGHYPLTEVDDNLNSTCTDGQDRETVGTEAESTTNNEEHENDAQHIAVLPSWDFPSNLPCISADMCASAYLYCQDFDEKIMNPIFIHQEITVCPKT